MIPLLIKNHVLKSLVENKFGVRAVEMGQASSRDLYVVNVDGEGGDNDRRDRKIPGRTVSHSEAGRISNQIRNDSIWQQQKQQQQQQHGTGIECIPAAEDDPIQTETTPDVVRRRLGTGVSWYVHDHRPPLSGRIWHIRL